MVRNDWEPFPKMRIVGAALDPATDVRITQHAAAVCNKYVRCLYKPLIFFSEVCDCYKWMWPEEVSLYINICLYFPEVPVVSERVSASACGESRYHYIMSIAKLFSSVSITKFWLLCVWYQMKQWLSKFAYQCGISAYLKVKLCRNSEHFYSVNFFLSWKEKLVPEARKQDNTEVICKRRASPCTKGRQSSHHHSVKCSLW